MNDEGFGEFKEVKMTSVLSQKDMIKTKELNKWYGDFHVLKNINLGNQARGTSCYLRLPVEVENLH